MSPALVWTLIGVAALTLLAGVFVVVKSWRQVPAGKALVVAKLGAPSRVFLEGGALIVPFVHRAEELDVTVKLIKVRVRARAKDDSRVEIAATCYVRVNKTLDDVQRVADSMGCARASSLSALEEVFAPKFSDAIVTVAAHLTLEEMRASKRDHFKDQVIAVIGRDLNGFVLDDVALERVEAAAMQAVDEVGWRS